MFRSKMPCLISGNSEVDFQTKSDLFVIGDVEIVSSVVTLLFQHIWPCSHAKQTPVAQWKRRHGAHSMTVARWFRPGVHHLKVTPVYPEPKKNPRNRNSSFDLEITVTRLRRVTAQNMDKAFPKAGP